MTFIPHEELKERGGLNLAPMIDFLFLMLAVFASLAVTRAVIQDTEIDIVKLKTDLPGKLDNPFDYKLVTVAILEDGTYKWMTEIRDYPMRSPSEIVQELGQEYEKGILPADKLKTQILLKIDRKAKWEPILQAVIAIREAGFEVRPVYEPL